MRKPTRIIATIAAALTLALFTTACGDQADPDLIGLHYAKGTWDGYKFDGCVEPGTRSGADPSDETIWLPDNLRYWKVAKTPDADSQNVLTVVAAPEPVPGADPNAPAPGGVQVDIAYQATMKLNTNCSDKDGGVLRQFWETIGRRLKADTVDGWKDMMGVTVETALTNSAKSAARQYTPSVLVAGSKQTELQNAIGPAFNTELQRLTGGPFFCGPEFRRGAEVTWMAPGPGGTMVEQKGTCPPVQISIVDVRYTSPEVQAAADKRAAAVQQAAALLAEAQGRLDAANRQQQLYTNPAWVRLQEAQMQYDAIVKACSQASSNCTFIVGDATTLVSTAGGR